MKILITPDEVATIVGANRGTLWGNPHNALSLLIQTRIAETPEVEEWTVTRNEDGSAELTASE